jgi:hypothetical protein
VFQPGRGNLYGDSDHSRCVSGCAEEGGFPQRVDLAAPLHSWFLRRGAGCPAELRLKSSTQQFSWVVLAHSSMLQAKGVLVGGCREWAPDHSRCECLRGRGELPPARRPGSASSLTVSAERRRPSSKTQSQVMNAAVHFSLTSSLRFHFETAPGAFPLDKNSEQIWSQNLQSIESSRDCCCGIVRSEFLFLFFVPFGRGARSL